MRVRQFPKAVQVFDLQDVHARDRGLQGEHPRPVGSMRFLLVGKVIGNNEPDVIAPPLELILRRNPRGYHLFFGQVQVESPAGRRQHRLNSGTYRLHIVSDYYQLCEKDVIFPMENHKVPCSVELKPGYRYPFDNAINFSDVDSGGFPAWRGPTLLRGSLYHADGSPIGDATVSLTDPLLDPQPMYTTDANGQWVLIVPVDAFSDSVPDGGVVSRNMSLAFSWPDPADTQQTVNHTKDVEEVKLGAQQSVLQSGLRGWVMQGGRAAAGAAITIATNGFSEQVNTRADGSWYFYIGLDQSIETDVTVSAQLPDGTSQVQTTKFVSGATVNVPTFQFE